MGGRVAVRVRIPGSSAVQRKAQNSRLRVSSQPPASAAISASAHRRVDLNPPVGGQLVAATTACHPISRPGLPIVGHATGSPATAYRDPCRSSASGRRAGDRFASLGGAGDRSPSGVPVGRLAGASGRALWPCVEGACAYRRFQLRLRIIIAVRGRWTCAVDRISSRRTLGVVVELVHRTTCFTHGRPPPLGRSRVTICHTGESNGHAMPTDRRATGTS
jgi:hypothetical protein